MNKQMIEVMRRRGELLESIAAQREQISEIGARWQAPLALADQGLVAARYMRSHPVLIAGVGALIGFRWRSVLGMAGGAWSLWKTFRSVSSDFSKLSSRF